MASPASAHRQIAGLDTEVGAGSVTERRASVEANEATADLVTAAADRIYRTFTPVAVHAFTLPSPLTLPFAEGEGSGAISSIMAAVRATGADEHVAASVDPGGRRLTTSAEQLEALGRNLGESFCVWASGTSRDLSVVFVLRLREAVGEADALAIQSRLRRMTNALVTTDAGTHRRDQQDSRLATLSAVLADIASQLDVDKVLEAIVEHSRALLGSDSAYLAEVDEATRRIRMRATTGIRDLGYKRGTAELGKGLAGAAAASRRVMFSSDYLSDPRFIHTPDTDANVLREGMHGVLAAPLQVGDRIIGVLAVTNHHPTDFSDADVQIIKSLADGAAIALENARLYSDQMRLVEELRELNAYTMRQHEALKRSVFIHDRLTEIVLQDHGIDAIAQQLSGLIRNPVAVLGRHFNQLAVAGIDPQQADEVTAAIAEDRSNPELAADLMRLTVERRPIHLTPSHERASHRSLIVAPILAGSDLLGHILVLEDQHPLEAAEFQTLEQAATVFALALTRARVVEEVEHRLRGDLVHDLISGTFDQDTIVKRGARLGHDLGSPQVILAIAPDTDAGEQASTCDGECVRRLESSVRIALHRRSLIAQTSIVDDVVVTLIALPRHAAQDPRRREAVVRALQTDLAVLLPHASASIGMSRVCTEPGGLVRSYREASQALRTCQRLGLRGATMAFERLGIERILSQVPDRNELADYVDSVLGPMIAYDRSRGTELIATLRCYLAASRRQRETARMLGIHVNSLNYRLRRIEEIGRLCLDDADTCLNLHVAVRTQQMLDATRKRHRKTAP